MKAIAVVNNHRLSPDSKTESSHISPSLIDIPDSCLIRSGKPFFIPEFDSDFRAYPSIAVRINRLGKCIAPVFAHRYWGELTGAVSIRGEQTLGRLRANGLPWSEALVFDRSLIVGDLVGKDSLPEKFSLLTVCGDKSISISEIDLAESIDMTISRVSRHNTVRQGDFILIGLAPEGIPLSAPSRLTMSLVDKEGIEIMPLLSNNIR